jgi:serine protease Do
MTKILFKNLFGNIGFYILLLLLGLISGGVAGAEFFKIMSKTNSSSNTNIKDNYNSTDSSKFCKTGYINEEISNIRQNAIVKATNMVSPCVVGIVVTQLEIVRSSYYSDDFFDFFFSPELVPRIREVERMGSGFIFCKEGYILTNYHVVEHAQKLYVTLYNGTQYEGKIIGADPQTDLAVVGIKAKDLPCAKLGNSSELMIGEWAIAIGNPFGFFINDSKPTVTVGVISALGRNFAPTQGVYYQGMIQTDASINQGNSGGPLVNALGEVIGINTFIFTGSENYRGSIGIGFAIPIDRAKRVAKELIQYGKRRPIYTGISVQDLNRSIALALGYEQLKGVVVTDVAQNSPGQKAGLLRGDIIIRMGNTDINSSADISGVFLDFFVGDTLFVSYIRKGQIQKTNVVLLEYKNNKRY